MARRRRIFLQTPLPDVNEFALEGPDFHHMARVLRLTTGAELILVDERGCCAEATLLDTGKRRLQLRLGVRSELPEPPPPRLRLLYGIARGGRTETVLQKSTELGVDILEPVLCRRSVARPKEAEGKRGRWLEVLRQAARQSERARLPELQPPRPLSEALEARRGAQEGGLALVAAFGGQSLNDVTTELRSAEEISMLVGPEGGLHEDELLQARDAGFRPITLGPRVLRTETAALTLLALAAFASGRLDP